MALDSVRWNTASDDRSRRIYKPPVKIHVVPQFNWLNSLVVTAVVTLTMVVIDSMRR